MTLCRFLFFCNLLKSFLQKNISNNRRVIAVQSALKKGMKGRLKDIENNILYAECTILDPQFRQRGFTNQRAAELQYKVLEIKMADFSGGMNVVIYFLMFTYFVLRFCIVVISVPCKRVFWDKSLMNEEPLSKRKVDNKK